VGAQVEIILVEPAHIGDAGHVRPLAGCELHGKAFLDGLVGHHIHGDAYVLVLGLEAIQQRLRHLALIAVAIALHAELDGRLCESRAGKRRQSEGSAGHDQAAGYS
jgi:hypothetical protein